MNKCKGCEWYGKPYWSIINPCDNCPIENTNIEIITRWQDPTIEELKKEIERLNNRINAIETQLQQKENIIKEVREYIKRNEFYLDYKTGACIKGVIPLLEILDKGE